MGIFFILKTVVVLNATAKLRMKRRAEDERNLKPRVTGQGEIKGRGLGEKNR